MQSNFWSINSGFKILLGDNFKTFCSLDAFKDHCFVNAPRYRNITIGTLFRVQSIWVGFRPELLVIKRCEPFFHFSAVFKNLHNSIVPEFGFGPQGKSLKGYTG